MEKEYTSRSPEVIIEEKDQVLACYFAELRRVGEEASEAHQQRVALRGKSIFGKLLNKLHVGEAQYSKDLREAYERTDKKYEADIARASALYEELEFAKFERLSIFQQTRLAEYAGWQAIHIRPRTIDRVGLNKQTNVLEKNGPKLDLSYPVDVALPSLSHSEPQRMFFAGPRVHTNLPNEMGWLEDRGEFAEKTVYLTNAYDQGVRALVTLPLDHFHLSSLTTRELWSICQAGMEADMYVRDVNAEDRAMMAV